MDASLIIPMMVLLPLLGGLIIFSPWWPNQSGSVKAGALGFSCLTMTFAFALASPTRFDWSHPVLQLESTTPWVSSMGLNFGFAVDGVSMWLILLSACLMPLAILGSFTSDKRIDERSKEFFAWLLILEAAMLGVFTATDAIFFYICFEFTLIPMYFLIGIYGGTQRLKAARIFFLYTFTGSMITFAGLIYTAWIHAEHTGYWSFAIADLITAGNSMSVEQQFWVMLSMLSGFAVKVPVFPVHTWLPLAHTEAPTAGSVVLAGVLLKLGTYALLRLAIPMVPQGAIEVAPTMGVLATIGVLYAALICWRQDDIKKLVAYSSVSHLGFCVLGLFALDQHEITGQSGAVLYMVNHGISTGALFLCIGMIYERYHTREMASYSGLIKAMPIWGCFMLLFCFASVGLPGLNGFIGEFLTLLGAFGAEQVLGWQYALFAGIGMILAAIYILYMAGSVIWGPVKLPKHDDHKQPEYPEAHDSSENNDHHAEPVVEEKDLNTREILVLTPLALACLIFGFFPTPMLKSVDMPLRDIMKPVVVALQEMDGEPNPQKDQHIQPQQSKQAKKQVTPVKPVTKRGTQTQKKQAQPKADQPSEDAKKSETLALNQLQLVE